MNSIENYSNDQIWNEGTWNDGICNVKLWKNGKFRKGRFIGETWENGIFESGTFEGQIWKNGMWKNGIWKGKEWIQGYNSLGHLLYVPPDQWPKDPSILTQYYKEYELYRDSKINSERTQLNPETIMNLFGWKLPEGFEFKSQIIEMSKNNIFLHNIKHEIKKQHEIKRTGLMKFHPDHGGSNDDCRKFLKLIKEQLWISAERMIKEN